MDTITVSMTRVQELLAAEKELIEIKKEKLGSCMNTEMAAGMSSEEKLLCSRNIEKREKTIEEILAEREKTHGDFKTHAAITYALKYQMKRSENWSYLRATQKESLDMIAHKIGRILAGDPDIKDHWDDIAGYAKLVAREIK